MNYYLTRLDWMQLNLNLTRIKLVTILQYIYISIITFGYEEIKDWCSIIILYALLSLSLFSFFLL